MKEEDMIKEAIEMEKENGHEEEDLDDQSKGFYKVLVALFMAIIIIMMIIPFYSIKHNPEPKKIEFIKARWDYNYTSHRLDTINQVSDIKITNIIRNIAVQITSKACKNSDVCYAKALYYYIKDQINYISDPPYEYIQGPEETLLGAGDCEDKSILLAMLLKSIGIRSRIVVVPGHAYVEARLDEAPNSYKTDGWIILDTTCTYCGFGESPQTGYGPVLHYYYV